ncbi:MAG TPA: hypothetical protein VMG10_13740 [Gemmataceae bacterium]|nr:hypothetical protein [Gemmataceae bacterium]
MSAVVYAVVILIIALVRHTPRFVDLINLSVDFYRLLVAAYPAPFRNEYGEAMVQLFRDSAREAYRRRGLLGLLAVWLRTLRDFTVSVIQQHRDKPVPVSSESVLLKVLLQKWQRLGAEALSVTAFSTWYGWHLLRLYFQRAVLVWTSFTAIAFGIEFASFFDSFTWMRERGTRIDIGAGTVQIWHVYEVEEPISDDQSNRDIRAWLERNPGLFDRIHSPARPWEFSFFSDIPGGTVVQWRTIENGPAHGRRRQNARQEPVLTRPNKSWWLRIPFGVLPALLLIWTIRAYLRRKTGSVAAMQSA